MVERCASLEEFISSKSSHARVAIQLHLDYWVVFTQSLEFD
jgi:hypothetical protein